MKEADILKTYREVSKEAAQVAEEEKDADKEAAFDLHTFIETYIHSPAALIRAFPTSNVDMNALEAHLWDRLRYYYPYDSFKHVEVKTKKEIEFINEVISSIEEWFYGAAWTSCIDTPTDAEIRQMFAGDRNTFLKKVRRENDTVAHPNLGRDGRDYGGHRGKPLPNIYEEITAEADPRQVYLRHAFKFFHGPAAILNTLTKIAPQREITANLIKFDNFIREVMREIPERLKEWGYGRDSLGTGLVRESMHSLDRQSDVYKRCRRTLFFMKTCLEGAEMMRRIGHPRLTREDFEEVAAWIQKTQAEEAAKGHSKDHIPFDFAVSPEFKGSVMHVNPKELPLALFAVDHLHSSSGS